MLRPLWLGVAVLLAVVVAPVHGQEVTLRWKFKEGQKFYVEDISTAKTNVSVLGMQVKETSKSTTITSYTIKKVTSDSIVVEQKIESAENKSEGGLGGATEKIVEKLKGASFTITMTPDGRVTKLEGYKDFAKKLADGDDEMTKMIALLFSEDLFRASAEQAFGMTPKMPVKKGDTWKQENKMPVPGIGDFKVTSDYTYQGPVDGGGDKISVKQSMVYMPPKGGDFGGVFKIVKGNIKTDSAKGHYVFDVEKGRLMRGTMEMTLRGSLTVEFSGQNLDLMLEVQQSTATRVLDQNPSKD